MGKPLKMGALLVVGSAGVVGAAMPINKGIRRGEPTSNYLLGPLTSCVPPKNDQTCVTNGTDFHIKGGEGPEYAVTADGRKTTYINPKTPQATQNQPPIIPGAAILAASIVVFCSSALFWGCVYMNRRQIFTRVIVPLRERLLGESRDNARRDERGDVEMVVATPRLDDPRSNNEGSRTSSSVSNHSPSATLGHPTAGNTTETGNYRNV